MPALSIRPAVEADCATMLELIRELAGFERMLNQVAVDEARLRRDGFGPRPRFGCLLAERRGEVLGMALFFPTYSTFAGEAGLYIEDLIVRDAHRGRGVGRALLAACAAEAERQGCVRLTLSALDWNRPARRLYEKLGFRQPPPWQPYGLAGEAFRCLAQEGRGG